MKRTLVYLRTITGSRRMARLALAAWDRVPYGIRLTLLRHWQRTDWPPVLVLVPKLVDACGTEQGGHVRGHGGTVLIAKRWLQHDDAAVTWVLLHELAHCVQFATGMMPTVDGQRATWWATLVAYDHRVTQMEAEANALASTWLGTTPGAVAGRLDGQAVVALASRPQWKNYP